MDKINAEVFVAVAKEGSFRRAAEKLGYTQAGISYIVKSMEEEAGFALFRREFGGVQLTREGEMLLPAMQQILISQEVLREEVSKIRGYATGHIRLLSFNSVTVCWLPDILDGFRRQYPDIEIELFACDSNQRGTRMIRDSEVDCGFLTLKASKDIEILPLREEPEVVVVSEQSPLAGRTEILPADLEAYPFIGYPPEEAPYVYEYARKHQVTFNQIMTVNNDSGSFAMINRNLGFGIFPQMIVEKCGFPLVAVPLRDGYRTPISLGLRSYQMSSLATRAFVDYVRQWVEQ